MPIGSVAKRRDVVSTERRRRRSGLVQKRPKQIWVGFEVLVSRPGRVSGGTGVKALTLEFILSRPGPFSDRWF